jgi:hypothetical protein
LSSGGSSGGGSSVTSSSSSYTRNTYLLKRQGKGVKERRADTAETLFDWVQVL